MADEEPRRAVEVAERFADGPANRRARKAAEVKARKLQEEAREALDWARFNAVSAAIFAVGHSRPEQAYLNIAGDTANAAGYAVEFATGRPKADEHAAQATLLLDIIGNPFRPPLAIAPSLLAWRDGTVKRLAEAAYEERVLPAGTLDFGRLAVLADALEEASGDAELVGHLRGPEPHYCGCWVVDLLTGRQ
jgi:hypothetical protein